MARECCCSLQIRFSFTHSLAWFFPLNRRDFCFSAAAAASIYCRFVASFFILLFGRQTDRQAKLLSDLKKSWKEDRACWLLGAHVNRCRQTLHLWNTHFASLASLFGWLMCVCVCFLFAYLHSILSAVINTNCGNVIYFTVISVVLRRLLLQKFFPCCPIFFICPWFGV